MTRVAGRSAEEEQAGHTDIPLSLLSTQTGIRRACDPYFLQQQKEMSEEMKCGRLKYPLENI